ncbi:hypothetical protein K437DRAFT_38276 [Tilletiaria anomala UBC 951]|uniref:Uncharacterized protein n=1 Tax=Tilletiaria anomala (strain ATCC 24038 / CBS 436.72 / UBC 951) TaxID=1037660 RepID=A0A066VAZ1_TILAU|nr:uncharacterized protein K437DRAFT_38276 [Tilletiaria anomala UBC 951]KDN37458.1 hypothetical protein K437DRAFT_38276 [Tilletiaria anomala UBC 951]
MHVLLLLYLHRRQSSKVTSIRTSSPIIAADILHRLHGLALTTIKFNSERAARLRRLTNDRGSQANKHPSTDLVLPEVKWTSGRQIPCKTTSISLSLDSNSAISAASSASRSTLTTRSSFENTISRDRSIRNGYTSNLVRAEQLHSQPAATKSYLDETDDGDQLREKLYSTH